MINVLYAGNYRVYDGILFSIMSMTKHCRQSLNIYILTADLTSMDAEYRPIEEHKAQFLDEYVKKVNCDSRVHLLHLGGEFSDWVHQSVNKKNKYTPFMFLRLFADRIDDIPDKIIYLDSDIMFNGDISELYGYDVSEFELGVVLDRYGKMWINNRYFNSGVLLMNLAKIRETRLFDKVKGICARRRMAFPDQSALNRCAKYILYLPRRFNEQGDLRDDTIIQHFSKRISWLPIVHTLNIKQYHIDDVHNKLNCFAYDSIYDEYNSIKLMQQKNEQ